MPCSFSLNKRRLSNNSTEGGVWFRREPSGARERHCPLLHDDCTYYKSWVSISVEKSVQIIYTAVTDVILTHFMGNHTCPSLCGNDTVDHKTWYLILRIRTIYPWIKEETNNLIFSNRIAGSVSTISGGHRFSHWGQFFSLFVRLCSELITKNEKRKKW